MLSATIVIPTCNRPERLRHTLHSLCDQSTLGKFEVIVVDDGSATDTPAVIRGIQAAYPCRWFWQRKDGFRAAMARNTGILFAAGETIILLDDDMVVQRDFVEAHLDLQESYTETVIVGLRNRVPYKSWAACVEPDFTVWGEEILPDARKRAVGEALWERFPWVFFATCNASVARKALLDAGLFDEEFQGWGFEDTELAYRLQAIGMSFRPLLEPVPYHLESPDWDMTEAESLYHLPPDKMSGYRKNSAYFAGKYPEDENLQRLLKHEGVLRMLASKTVEYVSGATVNAQPREGDHQPALTPDLDVEAGVHVLDPSVVARHLSLLTPYTEADEQLTREEAGNQTAARVSLLDELHRDFGIGMVGRPWLLPPRFSEWLWTVTMTPLVAMACVALFSALVITGRYRRIFPRRSS